MKKFLLLATLLVASVSASAQVFLGGSVGLNRNSTDNETEFTIMPEIGYSFNQKWAVGATLGYNYKYDNGLKTNIFGIDPYARYTYFSCADNRVNLFVDGGFGLGFGKSKYEDYSSETITVFNIGFKPGVAFNVTKKFSLVAHFGFLGYQGGNDAAENAGVPNKFGFDFSSMNLTFGFYYNF